MTPCPESLPGAGRGVFVVLPVLNERANIDRLLDGIDSVLRGYPYTIGILDDGSTDGTVEFLAERMSLPGHRLHLIRRRKTIKSSQRGSALRALMLWGLDHTDHGIFVEMDGDLSHRPEEIPAGIAALRHADIVIASKYETGSAVVNRPKRRRMVSKVCSFAVRCLLSRKVRDYSNGYRFYTRTAAEFAAGHTPRYGSPIYLSEVLAQWLRAGFSVKEIPSVYVGRNEGLSKLRIRDLAKAAIGIFDIAWRYKVAGFGATCQRPTASTEEPLEADP